MANNISATLPVTAGEGFGAWVDVSGMVPAKTISVDGGPFDGILVIEMSDDGAAHAAPSPAPPFTAPTAVPAEVNATAQWMRVHRLGGSFGAPVVTLAAAATSAANVFGALAVPASSGVGAATSLISGGEVNTFGVVGPFSGQLRIEVSTDGTNFSPALTFDSGSGVAQTFLGTLSAARVRRVFVAGGAAPTVWVGSGTNSGGGGGAVARVDSVMTVGQTLVSYVNLSLGNGDLVYVGNETHVGQPSICDYVRVRIGAALTPTEGEVWNSTAMTSPLVQYERLHTPSDKYLQVTDWTITADPALGEAIIDNDGSAGHPISFRELNRRRAGDNQGIPGTVIIRLPDIGTAPDRTELKAAILDNWWGTDGNAYPILLGNTTRVGATLAVVAFTPENHPANTPNVLQAVGIGTRCTGIVGTVLVRNLGDTKKCVVEAVIDADNVQVSQPRSTDIINADTGAVVAFAVNEVVEVITLASLPIWPFVPNAFEFPAASKIDFSGLTANFNILMLGDSEPEIFDCLFTDAQIQGGGAQANFSVCGYDGVTTIFSDGHAVFWSCAFLENSPATAGHVDFVRYGFDLGGTMDLVHCRLLNRGGRATVFQGAIGVGMWAGTLAQGPFLLGDNGAYFGWRCPLFGALNSAGALPNLNSIASLAAGSYMDVTEGLITVVTASDFVLDDGSGLSWARTSISLINPLGGGVIDVLLLRAVGDFSFTGALITSGAGATSSFLGNPGSALALANQAAAQQYPTGRRIFRALRVTKLASTAGVDVPVTLVIAGGTSPTAMTVTVRAADPAGTVYSDTAHPVTVGLPQSFDIQMTAALDGAPGTVKISATLES